MFPLLCCYPFADPRVRLVEGFSEYDGVLGDTPGAPHKGIDYVIQDDDTFEPFDVYAMHDGVALQGISETWGNFVALYASPLSNGDQFTTIYAHLDGIDPELPFIPEHTQVGFGAALTVGMRLGRAGTSGATNGIPQLHIELHKKVFETQQTTKLDPYGINGRASSGRYPRPGVPLNGLQHAWVTDRPQLAST